MTQSKGGWSEYWASEGASGEVFVSATGEKHPALETFWRRSFQGLKSTACLVDLASGAGSVFAHLPENHGFQLHASDISHEALALLEERVPGTITTVASADNLPYRSESFDFVISQYGVEYAGRKAFLEAARIVKPGGAMAVLCHYRDGYIDRRNRSELTGAEVARDCEFIQRAMALTEATFRSRSQEKTRADFVPAERRLAKAVMQTRHGVHAHLYAGFRRLYEHHRQYDPADITMWLTQMQREVDRSIYRLTCMVEAAQSQQDMWEISQELENRGMEAVSFKPFETSGNPQPIAWSLTATRAVAQ